MNTMGFDRKRSSANRANCTEYAAEIMTDTVAGSFLAAEVGRIARRKG